MNKNLLSILTVCMFVVGMVACDVTGEHNYDFEQGSTLAIVGGPSNDTLLVPTYRTVIDSSVTPNDTSIVEANAMASYYSKAFTINKDYSWTVSPDVQNNVRRDGEYIDIIVSNADAGTYTISVDDGEYQGETTLVVVDTTAAQ